MIKPGILRRGNITKPQDIKLGDFFNNGFCHIFFIFHTINMALSFLSFQNILLFVTFLYAINNGHIVSACKQRDELCGPSHGGFDCCSGLSCNLDQQFTKDLVPINEMKCGDYSPANDVVPPNVRLTTS
ncbi:hypothetical protein BDA99DRAFT_575297 [Phascolomyces articulosus]|uniref:Uncharacterized protein n=1 Tax=Phascolomyces articulosus TaxID=60185 RepID=A0AAD5JRF2_9FUNG|nr:hypothetical protein BDA99DRAFT_575297 [Phascolomyces articulosus]